MPKVTLMMTSMVPMVLLLMTSITAVATGMAEHSAVRVVTESAMRDINGTPIYDCLEPHIQRFDGTWYAYGFTCRNGSQQFATTCYSSTDLKTWTKRAHWPTNATLDGTTPQSAIALWSIPLPFIVRIERTSHQHALHPCYDCAH